MPVAVTTATMWLEFENPALAGSELVEGQPEAGLAPEAERRPEAAWAAEPALAGEPAGSEHPSTAPGEPAPASAQDAESQPASPPSTRWTVQYDDNHWDDPRPDLAANHPAWAVVLKAAWQLDGEEPDGCFGVLHGLRGQGAALEPLAAPEWAREKFGSLPRWKLARGEIDAAQWEAWERQWLDPVQARVMQVLAGSA
jgi:hypothetical protein